MKSLTLTLLFGLFFFYNLQAQHHNNNRVVLGVYANQVSDEKAEKLNFKQKDGEYITEVLMNSAAEEIGLQPFDYVYRIGDQDFQNHQGIGSALKDYQPGDQAMVYFVRNGKEETRLATLKSNADSERRKRSRSEDPFLGVQPNHTKVPNEVNGVRVDVVSNTTAEIMGLEDDDIITQINDYSTLDWHDLRAAINRLEVGEKILVTYWRDGESNTLESPVQSLAATKNHDNQNQDIETVVVEEENEESNSGSTFVTQMKDMEIEMEDMPKEEALEMKEKVGVDMPVVQNLEIDRLNIFPNPNEGMFNIRFSLPNIGTTAIRVFNSSGKMIYANDLGNFSGDFNGRIDLTNNPAGAYFLMVQQEGYSISKKVVVARK